MLTTGYCNIDELITNMDDNYNYWLVLTGPSSDSEGEQDTTTRENVVGRKQQTTEVCAGEHCLGLGSLRGLCQIDTA